MVWWLILITVPKLSSEKLISTSNFQLIRSRRSVRGFFRTFLLIIVIALCMLLAIVRFITTNNNPLSITRNFIYIEPITSYFRKHHNFLYKIDYHDYDYIDIEKTRYDLPGENGQPVYAEKEEEELNTKLFNQNGYYGMISDKIALNRSLPDVRPDECPRKFLADLPTTSIIIPFYNDHLSTLLRTVYSVVNRSPRHLLKEVILVNDHSTKDFLYQELADYIEKHFKGLVKLLVLPKRSGLIWARLGLLLNSGDSRLKTKFALFILVSRGSCRIRRCFAFPRFTRRSKHKLPSATSRADCEGLPNLRLPQNRCY